MTDKNKFVDRPDIRDIFETLNENVVYTSGLDNEHKQEVLPELQIGTAEKYIKGHSNSIIVLGKDRPAGISSGNGGKGRSGCAAIDIVVGLNGKLPIEKIAGGVIKSQKDFEKDAARVYISQMSDLDEYFKIPKIQAIFKRPLPGNLQSNWPTATLPLENSKDTSGIGIKADHIRIIARDSVKIVTAHYGTNTAGRSVARDGISLMAGYDMMPDNPELALEPMVKGNKLVKFLEILINSIQNVRSVMSSFMKEQNEFNLSLLNHRHVCSAPGNVSDTMVAADGSKKSLTQYQMQLIPDDIYITIKNELLKQYLHSSSKDYILSKWHKLN